jgi:hypothetical protein
MPIERADFVSVPVQDMDRRNALMLHRRYAPPER